MSASTGAAVAGAAAGTHFDEKIQVLQKKLTACRMELANRVRADARLPWALKRRVEKKELTHEEALTVAKADTQQKIDDLKAELLELEGQKQQAVSVQQIEQNTNLLPEMKKQTDELPAMRQKMDEIYEAVCSGKVRAKKPTATEQTEQAKSANALKDAWTSANHHRDNLAAELQALSSHLQLAILNDNKTEEKRLSKDVKTKQAALKTAQQQAKDAKKTFELAKPTKQVQLVNVDEKRLQYELAVTKNKDVDLKRLEYELAVAKDRLNKDIEAFKTAKKAADDAKQVLAQKTDAAQKARGANANATLLAKREADDAKKLKDKEYHEARVAKLDAESKYRAAANMLQDFKQARKLQAGAGVQPNLSAGAVPPHGGSESSSSTPERLPRPMQELDGAAVASAPPALDRDVDESGMNEEAPEPEQKKRRHES